MMAPHSPHPRTSAATARVHILLIRRTVQFIRWLCQRITEQTGGHGAHKSTQTLATVYFGYLVR